MGAEDYYDEPHATVSYNETADVVVGELKEFVEGSDFKEYMNTLIDVLEEKHATKMVADTSTFDAALTQEDQVWSVEDWTPRAEDAGLEHLALVMPEAVVAEMSIENIINMTDDSITRDVFTDRSEAINWLEQQSTAVSL